MNGLFSVSYMGCHPNPIDELIFSEGFYHQPVGITIESKNGESRKINQPVFDGMIEGF